MKKDKKQKTVHSRSWTLLVVGDLGNITSFRLPKALLLGAVGSFVSLCVLAAVAFYSYHGMRTENLELKANLGRVERELLAANEAKEGAEVRLMFLEAKADPTNHVKKGAAATPEKSVPSAATKGLSGKKHLKPAPEKKPEPKNNPETKKEKAPVQLAHKDAAEGQKKKPLFTETEAATSTSPQGVKPDKPKQTVVDGQNPSEPKKPEDPQAAQTMTVATAYTESLLVKEMELLHRAADNSLRFQFSLKNVDIQGRKISGYTFVVLQSKEGSQEPARGSPWTPLKEGKPTIFKRGQYFSISRFKYVRGTIPQIKDPSRFDTATVYVYTETGELMLEQVFDVQSVLKT